MSKTESTDQPETVVVSPDLDSIHRRGDGLEPACSDRLHHIDDDTEFRLTQQHRTRELDYCGHPECFGGQQC